MDKLTRYENDLERSFLEISMSYGDSKRFVPVGLSRHQQRSILMITV